MLGKTAIRMQCEDCGQEFDLLNCPWPKPEGNSKYLHTTGTGHRRYRILYSDGTEKNKTERIR